MQIINLQLNKNKNLRQSNKLDRVILYFSDDDDDNKKRKEKKDCKLRICAHINFNTHIFVSSSSSSNSTV